MVNNTNSAPLIFNYDSTYDISVSGIFKNNTAYAVVGSMGGVTIEDNSLFLNNTSTISAVYSTALPMVVGEGVIFKDNIATNASGAALSNTHGVTIGAGTIFDGNYSINVMAGAINLSGGTSTITDTNFTNNAAK